MSKYLNLKQNNPTLRITKKPREVIFTTISCMCDNIHTLRLKKNNEGDFKLSGIGRSGMGHAFSNWQIKHSKSDIEWMADANKWNEVIIMINTGTSIIEKVKSR